MPWCCTWFIYVVCCKKKKIGSVFDITMVIALALPFLHQPQRDAVAQPPCSKLEFVIHTPLS